ncbi:hypothetical protein DKX38_009369 [Salix brachista]|uniref:Uncharacterized protein n=1 Tax=Salix brachista TaxID=2182728 RepID=A0A5N5MAK2_9ROSI|nr:hypothetical protein DKX38_009369 [Salix brachista]
MHLMALIRALRFSAKLPLDPSSKSSSSRYRRIWNQIDIGRMRSAFLHFQRLPIVHTIWGKIVKDLGFRIQVSCSWISNSYRHPAFSGVDIVTESNSYEDNYYLKRLHVVVQWLSSVSINILQEKFKSKSLSTCNMMLGTHCIPIFF